MKDVSRPTVQIGACTIIGASFPASPRRPKPVDVFYRIPYATAERFELPIEATLTGTIDATQEEQSNAGPEDRRLRLNVTRPAGTAATAGLPVMVYLHGGAFYFGDPLDRDLRSAVAWSEAGGIVAVSVGYRLGVLGFPPFGGAASNLGLRDQRVAMEWVRRWIGGFGGDGEGMTVVGVSAGAHSIGHHMLSPSPPPFTKAILESGSPTARFVLSPSHPRSLVQQAFLLQQTLCSSTAELKAMPLRPLLAAADAVWATFESSVQWPFQPIVDDDDDGIIPDAPVRLWAQRVADGRARGMRVVTGFCSNEGTAFVPRTASSGDDFRSFFAALIPGLSAEDMQALEALYPDPVADPSSRYAHPPPPPGNKQQQQQHRRPPGEGAQFLRLAAAYGDFAYVAPVLHTAHVLSSAGARVYVYEYAAVSSPEHGASHASHSPAVCRDAAVVVPRFPGLAAVAEAMHARWTRFVCEPEGHLEEEDWPAFVSPAAPAGGQGKMLVFGEGNDELAGGGRRGVAVRERCLGDEEMQRMKFWWDRMELVQGMGERT